MPWDSPDKPRDEDMNQRRRTRRRWVRSWLDRRRRTTDGRRTIPFKPDWTIPPAPAGDDEPEAQALYESVRPDGRPWAELQEFVREAWRREIRDT